MPPFLNNIWIIWAEENSWEKTLAEIRNLPETKNCPIQELTIESLEGWNFDAI